VLVVGHLLSKFRGQFVPVFLELFDILSLNIPFEYRSTN